MTHSLTNQSRKVMALATESARSFNHAYVGTEHILLGLMEEKSAGIADVLETLEIDADKIRAEIEKLVNRGDVPVTLHTLPLTPRARRAIEVAQDETRLMDQKCVHPEHLFLGLMNDPSGVACQVLLNLGVEPANLRKEVFKTRVAQMKIVACRPANSRKHGTKTEDAGRTGHAPLSNLRSGTIPTSRSCGGPGSGRRAVWQSG